MAYCIDNFSITVAGQGFDASITIPGEFPIYLDPGSAYFIGFTYVTGGPAATGWLLEWEISDDSANDLPGEASPSSTISPQVPVIDNNTGSMKNGSIRGNVPSPTGNRLYIATVTILQS